MSEETPNATILLVEDHDDLAATIGAFLEDSGFAMDYAADGSIALASEAKPKQVFEYRGADREFVLEQAITTDFALVHALRGDRHGNLVFDKSARNFSPLAAMAGAVCVAEVEELVEPGELDPDAVHLPGIYVDRLVVVGTDVEKRIEKRTVRQLDETAEGN